MRRNNLVLWAVLGAAFVWATGATLAQTIFCPGQGVACVGTVGEDTLHGTDDADTIYARGGADTIYGNRDHDTLYGDFQEDPAQDGSDRIYGGNGNDVIVGFGGADLLVGGAGADFINAAEGSANPPGKDRVAAGRSNDIIRADDGYQDAVNCGPGTDSVWFDQDLDTLSRCEVKHPVP